MIAVGYLRERESVMVERREEQETDGSGCFKAMRAARFTSGRHLGNPSVRQSPARCP